MMTRLERSAGASWLSAVILVGPLALFAELLIRRTHHRPLAAATFASFALVAWVIAELLSRRVLDAEISVGRRRARSVAWWLGSTCSLLIIVRAFVGGL
jgi:hypothetical protein